MSENYKAVVWSKNNCAACNQVKALLKSKNFSIEERNIETTYSIEDFKKVLPNAKTVPQVFINEEYIGGLNEVKSRLALLHDYN